MTKAFLLTVCFSIFTVANGQTSIDKRIKIKGDSVLKVWVGNGLNRIVVKYKESYHSRNDYRATYTVTFPENDYSDEFIIYFDKAFNVLDSNFFRTFPDYVLENRPNDLISKDSAISSAIKSGLCVDNILEFSLFRLYNSKVFVWTIDVDNKEERQKDKLLGKKRRTTKKCQRRLINANTGQIISDI